MAQIYLAGPLFSLAERMFNRALKTSLEDKGYTTFLPQDEPQEGAPAREIFDRDERQLQQAQVVVANMDGPDPDSGTCWECGFAYGIGKRVIAFRTDVRPNEEGNKTPFNLMIAASADRIIDLPRLAKEKDADKKEWTIDELFALLIAEVIDSLRALGFQGANADHDPHVQ